MLRCAAIATPRVCNVDGLTVFGAELANPDIGYVTINRASTEDEGAHHYVEMWDQTYGKFDGLRAVDVAADRRGIVLSLTFDVNGQGRVFRIESDEPMDFQSAVWIEALAEEIRARR